MEYDSGMAADLCKRVKYPDVIQFAELFQALCRDRP